MSHLTRGMKTTFLEPHRKKNEEKLLSNFTIDGEPIQQKNSTEYLKAQID